MQCGDISGVDNIYFCNNTSLLGDVSNILTLSGGLHVLEDASFDQNVDICGILTLTAQNTAYINGPSNIVIDPAPLDSSGGSVTINGSLNILGSQTFVNSETVEISDNIITLNVYQPLYPVGGIEVNDVCSSAIGYLIYDICANTWDTSGADFETQNLLVFENTDICGNLNVTGHTNLTDVSAINVTISNFLDVSAVEISNNLTVGGNIDLSENLIMHAEILVV